MKDQDCVRFLQWALPQLQMRWPGFRKVRRQVCKRVERRLRQLGLEHGAAYRDYLERHSREWIVLDELCRISISRFYRDRRVFDLLRNQAIPQLAAAARVRGDYRMHIWSAGCASGEEVYTLKIIWELDGRRRFPDVSLQITATDADSRLLRRAALGCYGRSSLKDLPHEWMELVFDRSEDEFRIRERFRSGIAFMHQDIRRSYPSGPFDLILCRHLVFTYFDQQLQRRILGELIARLHRKGLLVTGKQESLPPPNCDLQLVEPHSGIYRWHGVSGTYPLG